jgi:hypothetical protein
MVPVEIGTLLMDAGDSQTEGRAPDGPCENPGNAFRLAINENEGQSIPTFVNLGQGGSSLNQTRLRYLASSSRTNRTLVHAQESGSQTGDSESQDTPEKLRDQIIAFFLAASVESLLAKFGYEYPHSFWRQGDAGRNWDDLYQAALEEAITILRNTYGIIVYVARVRQFVEALEVYDVGGVTFTAPDLWYQEVDERGPWAHYTAFGNAAVAFARLISLGRDPRTWNFTSWTDITADQIAALKHVAGQFIDA